jgi:hypothetical protein
MRPSPGCRVRASFADYWRKKSRVETFHARRRSKVNKVALPRKPRSHWLVTAAQARRAAEMRRDPFRRKLRNDLATVTTDKQGSVLDVESGSPPNEVAMAQTPREKLKAARRLVKKLNRRRARS